MLKRKHVYPRLGFKGEIYGEKLKCPLHQSRKCPGSSSFFPLSHCYFGGSIARFQTHLPIRLVTYPITFPWSPHYIPMIFPWYSHGIPLYRHVCPWYPYCIHMNPCMDDFPSCHLWYSNDLPSIPLISILHYIHMICHWWFLSYPLAIKYPEDIPIGSQYDIPSWWSIPNVGKHKKKNDNLSHLILLIDWVRWFPRHCWLRPLYCIHIKDPQYIPTCNMLSDMIFIYSPSWSIPIISLIFHNCWFYIYMSPEYPLTHPHYITIVFRTKNPILII